MMDWLLPSARSVALDQAIQTYRAVGYARLGVVMSEAGLKALSDRADDLMLGRVRYEGMFFQHEGTTGRHRDVPIGRGWEGPSLRYRKLEKLELDDVFASFLRNELFAAVAARLVRGKPLLNRLVLFGKPENGGSEIPWHQDGGKLWGLSETPEVTLWTALDDAPVESGCLDVLPGSHLDGLVTPLGGMVPEPHVERRGAEARVERVPAKRGEMILLHNMTWHRSLVNRTSARRRSVTVCLMNETTHCMRTRNAPRTFRTL
jgi:phytanoyl-CoA hydroxylase